MKGLFDKVKQLKRKQKEGQGMVEYALIIGFIALMIVGALRLIPQPLEEIFGDIAEALGGSPT